MRLIGLDCGAIFTNAALKTHRALNRAAERMPGRTETSGRSVADRMSAQVGQMAGYIELTGLRWAVTPYEQKLSDVVSRGSRLTPADYPVLKERFNSLVDLCREGSHDQTHGVENGFNTFNLKVTDNGAPSTAQIKEFLDFVTNPKNQPVYFHCEAGVGRTGILASCYRMAVQGWSLERAIAESMDRGMRLPNQLACVKQFAADLQAGKVEGYPLAQPVPEPAPVSFGPDTLFAKSLAT